MPAAVALKPVQKKFEIACSSCNLRELCLPANLCAEDLARVENIVYARRRLKRGEALFQAGDAYQQMSLRPELDQRETERAVNAYDRVIVEYPRSEFVEEARTRKAQLRDKLAEKVFLNAEFYFDNENYSATEIYLTDLIAMYTDTSWIPAAYALLARTKCQQGLGDRASEVYARLRENYPDSQATREVVGELPERCRATQAASDGDAPAPTSGR